MPQNQQLFTGMRTAGVGAVGAIGSLQGLAWAAPRLNQRTLFVDGATGNDVGGRGSPQYPYATISKALTAAVAGTTIIIAPGTYAENLTVSANYVNMVGIQGANGRPAVAVAGVALTVTGNGFSASGMSFQSTDSDSVVHNGNNGTYDNCAFLGSAGQAATEACLRLQPAAANGCAGNVFDNCQFSGSTSGAGVIFQHATTAGGGGSTSNNRILNSRFFGNGVDLLSAVAGSGGGSGIFLNTTIQGNFFQTVGAAFVYGNMDQGAAGDLAANSAIISGNYFADAALIAAQFDISGQPNVMFVGNYDAAGLVNGAAFNS